MTKQFIGRVLLFGLTTIVVSSLSARLSAQTPDKPTNAAGEITGHIDVRGGESLARTNVVVFPFGGGQSRETAKIDRNGNFKFTGLQPGLYGVNISVPG